jgi:hypothetical protein
VRFQIANTLLAGTELQAAFNVRINGQIVVQRVDAIRALASTFYDRGNLSTAIDFSVSRVFDDLREARRFALFHYSAVPKSGDIYVDVANPGEAPEWITIPGGKMPSCGIVLNGVDVTCTYNLVGGIPTDGGPPGDPEPYDEMIRRGKVSIANGARTVSVVFGSSLPSTPFVTCNVLMPTGGGSKISATVVEDTITNNGFTAELSGPVPNGNYKLSYIAIQ